MVSYNSAEHLGSRLATLTQQLGADDELVVVDNASTDDSVSVARAAAPLARIIELKENKGFAEGCNIGAADSRGPLLLFLNPDAGVQEGCLDTLKRTAGERPDWGAWQPLVVLEDGKHINTAGGIVHWLGFGWAGQCHEPVGEAPATAEEVGFVSGAALAVRREAWESAAGFDPDYFMYGEDLDLSLRLRLAGWKIGVVPRAKVAHDYEFTKGDYKWYLLERNRWSTVLATYPSRLLLAIAPVLFVCELALLAVAARGGWLKPKLRSNLAVMRNISRTLARRKLTQQSRSISDAQFARGLTSSLDSPYLEGVANTPLLAGAQRWYWSMVVKMLSRNA